jgi:branched-chain amino acid transport system permease protein
VLEVALQFLVNGLVTGCFYALIALGLTLIFGMMGVVNFAHGEFFVLGGSIAYLFVNVLGFPFWLAVVLVVVCMSLLGALFDVLLVRPLRSAHILSTALVTIGLSIFLLNTTLVLFGPSPRAIETGFSKAPILLGPIVLTEARLFAVALGGVAILLAHLLIRKTRLGRAMRATFQNRDAAALAGVNVELVYTLTFALGTGMAALAGALLGAIFVVHPSLAELATLKAFVVVILGGMGSFIGAVAGGLILGVVESLWGGFFSSGYQDVVGFLLVILILLFRPTGLFRARGARAG